MADSSVRVVQNGSWDGRDPSLLVWVNVLLRYRYLIAGLAIGFAVVALAASLLQTRMYASDASFAATSRRATSSISGVAAQLGLSISTADAAQSPAFYADLAKSRDILRAAVRARYQIQDRAGPVAGSLIELYSRLTGAPMTEASAAQRLAGHVRADAVTKTGVIRLVVEAERPELATQIADSLLVLLNDFNTKTRQSQAGAERRFAAGRLAEVRHDLAAAEQRLQSFYESNRGDFRQSPQLKFTEQRLLREVENQTTLFTGLTQSYEQARMEEVRDSPVITLIERPADPALPLGRGTVRNTAIGVILGFFLGGFIAAILEYFNNVHVLDEQSGAVFATLRNETLRDVRQPLAVLAAKLGRSARQVDSPD